MRDKREKIILDCIKNLEDVRKKRKNYIYFSDFAFLLFFILLPIIMIIFNLQIIFLEKNIY